MSPASNRPSSSAGSIAENTSSVFVLRVGKRETEEKIGGRDLPGIAIRRRPAATSSRAIGRFEISSGPQVPSERAAGVEQHVARAQYA